MSDKPLLRRIRDGKRYIRPQQKVEFDDWDQIREKAVVAESFLKPDNLIYATLKQSLADAEEIVLQNRTREVREEHVVSELLKKVFITPKKIQDDELVGQIKFIRTFFAELQSWIDFKSDIEQKEAQGIVSVGRERDRG